MNIRRGNQWGRQLIRLLAVLIVLVTLTLFLGAGRFLFVHIKERLEENLAAQLITLANWADTELRLEMSRMLPDLLDIPWLEEEDTEYVERLQESLAAFVQANGLERLIIYDAEMRVKIDTAGELAVNSENPYTLIDQAWIEDALAGDTVATLGYHVEDNSFMRVYHPLVTDSGETVGLMALEGQRRYFEPLRRMRNFMITVGLAISGAVILLALLTHHVLWRFVQLEEAVQHADRLQTLGTLAAGMAHEIRNPLGIMRITTETLRSELQVPSQGIDPERDEMCQDILGEIDRIHDLISRFLSFAKPGEISDRDPAEVAPAIFHTVRLCQKSKSRIAIEVDVESNLNGAVTPLPTASLQQVLFNLLRNAQEAMEEADRGGTIRVSATRRDQSVMIRIRDEGVGMTSAQVRRAGEPFVTTKTDGTGLGLSISRNLLASVQGRLDIESRPGEGTVVTATVPLISSHALKSVKHPQEERES